MKGSILMGGTLIVAAAMGLGLWYTSNSAYYYEVNDIEELTVGAERLPVSDYRGIDADTSPLKMRACFRVNWDYDPQAGTDAAVEPLVAPTWFDCFDARRISEDLKAGKAVARLARSNVPFGFDTYIAQYPDGRAFLWPQVNACGAAQFSGESLPDDCPDPSAVPESVPNISGATLRLTPILGDEPQPILARDVTAAQPTASAASFHACFRTDMSLGLLSETFVLADDPQLRPVADAMACFDADAIAADIADGAALAVIAEREIAPSIDRVIAFYDDGRAFAWHQYND